MKKRKYYLRSFIEHGVVALPKPTFQHVMLHESEHAINRYEHRDEIAGMQGTKALSGSAATRNMLVLFIASR